MAHFAEIDSNNIVIRTVVLDDAHENGGTEYLTHDLRLGGRWIKTSYNNNIRSHYAGIGYYYDEAKDRFIPPKPFPSWILNEVGVVWEAPITRPAGKCYWDESSLLWVMV